MPAWAAEDSRPVVLHPHKRSAVEFGSFERKFGTCVVVVEFAVGVIVKVLDRGGVLPPVLTRRRKVVPVSLQQSLIDLFIVSVIAALTPSWRDCSPGCACLRR